MESKVIAGMLVDNVEASRQEVLDFYSVAKSLIEGIVLRNAIAINEIEDEKQLFEVAEDVLKICITDEQIDDMIKLPAIAESVDNVGIKMFRPIVTRYILSLLDKLLDKLFGPDWFKVLKGMAVAALPGVSER